jgi:hypothetical protein
MYYTSPARDSVEFSRKQIRAGAKLIESGMAGKSVHSFDFKTINQFSRLRRAFETLLS